MSDVNKIVKTLSPKRLREFMEGCDRSPGLTLRKVVALAGDSLTSARSFREGPLRRFQEKRERKREVRERWGELSAGGSTEALEECAETLMAEELCQQLMNNQQLGVVNLERYSRVLMRVTARREGRHECQRGRRNVERSSQQVVARVGSGGAAGAGLRAKRLLGKPKQRTNDE